MYVANAPLAYAVVISLYVAPDSGTVRAWVLNSITASWEPVPARPLTNAFAPSRTLAMPFSTCPMEPDSSSTSATRRAQACVSGPLAAIVPTVPPTDFVLLGVPAQSLLG